MLVYALINKNNPSRPFYIGITNHPEQRFKAHLNNPNHLLFSSKQNMRMKILIDTGDNEFSEVLAEKIEIELIQYFGTYYGGSNKCIDASKVFEQKYKYKKSSAKKNKDKKIWKKTSKYLYENPFSSVDEIVEFTDCQRSVLNRICKQETGLSIAKYIEEYKESWFEKHGNHINIVINW